MSASTAAFTADFVRYLERSGPDVEPVYRTMAHATVQGDWPDFAPAWHLQRFPLGRVWVYPGFVAFLSASRLRAGEIPRGGQLALKMFENLREMSLTDHLFSMAREIDDRVRRPVSERVGRWLANPNSIVVPTGTVTSVTRRRAKTALGQVQWIEVESAGRHVLFSPPTTVGGREAVAGLSAAFGRDWEPRLFELLARSR